MAVSWQHHLLPEVAGVPVLMYHRVWPGQNDKLTISPENLGAQWQVLLDDGYQALTMQQFLDIVLRGRPAPERPVLITFDDGYRNNMDYAYPLLRKLGLKATFFVVGETLAASPAQASTIDQLMSREDLASLDPGVVQIGIHGHAHANYRDLPMAETQSDLASAVQAFDRSRLDYLPVLAYPYGGRPRGAENQRRLRESLRQLGVVAAFRIGNRVNRLPIDDVYEIKRINIDGSDDAATFRLKLRKGKLRLF